MERVTVADNASVGQLIWEISTKLGIAAEDITLSRNPGLVPSPTDCLSAGGIT